MKNVRFLKLCVLKVFVSSYSFEFIYIKIANPAKILWLYIISTPKWQIDKRPSKSRRSFIDISYVLIPLGRRRERFVDGEKLGFNRGLVGFLLILRLAECYDFRVGFKKPLFDSRVANRVTF